MFLLIVYTVIDFTSIVKGTFYLAKPTHKLIPGTNQYRETVQFLAIGNNGSLYKSV